MKKSSVAEIRERFDKDVERFSNLDTGQLTFYKVGLLYPKDIAASYHSASVGYWLWRRKLFPKNALQAPQLGMYLGRPK